MPSASSSRRIPASSRSQSLEEVLKSLNASNHALAIDIAQLPEQIKGYGHVKARNAAAAQSQWARLMGQWRDPSQQAKAA